MNKLIILLLILFLIPVSFAFECSLTSDEEYCNELLVSEINETEKDIILSHLLYQNINSPNHSFIEDYNLNIEVIEPPENTTIYNSREIKNAWFSFLAIFPAVYEEDILYVPENIKLRSEYDYSVQIPENYVARRYPQQSSGDCKRLYRLTSEEAIVNYYLNENPIGEGELCEATIDSNGTIKAELNINTNLEVKRYEWERYCCSRDDDGCRRYCYDCEYYRTDNQRDNIRISEEKNVILYDKIPSAYLEVARVYSNTTQARFYAEDYSFAQVRFNSSYLNYQNYIYNLVFDKKPYYFAYLNAQNFSHMSHRNLFISNNSLFVKNIDNCEIWSYNHFNTISSDCDLTPVGEELPELETTEKNVDLDLVIYVLLFILIVFIIYRVARSQLRKIVLPLLIILILLSTIPLVFADDPPPEEEEPEECGLMNLASCIPQKIYEYILLMMNAPLLPILAMIQALLTAEVYIDMFHGVWSIIRYIISFFYIFLFLYAGFILLTSSGDPMRRAQAKDVLKNTFFMIILIQGSFYIYGLVLDLSAILNSGMLNLVNPEFFLITADNILNIGLEFVFTFVYLGTITVTMIMLTLRYIIVSLGVVFFPIGIFCYFVPPLKGYGRFILHALGIFIFVTFFDLLIILACSMLIDIPMFESIKILVMTACFLIVNYTLWLAIKFAIKRSVDDVGDKFKQAVKYIAIAAA